MENGGSTPLVSHPLDPVRRPEESTPPVCSKRETSANVSLRGTALDRALLLTSDGSSFLQVVGHVGDTLHKVAVITGVIGACRNQISDGAATGE